MSNKLRKAERHIIVLNAADASIPFPIEDILSIRNEPERNIYEVTKNIKINNTLVLIWIFEKNIKYIPERNIVIINGARVADDIKK